MTKQLSLEMKNSLKKLSHIERKYFQIMWSRYGVLFITSKPGVAKSAIAKSIAEKMGFRYIDRRLTMDDETDFKYPYLVDKKYHDKTIKVSDYAVPAWAHEANEAPTIIHFEELNRASLLVRNAALQILLEREIGQFKFNDNVLMMASGNLGDEDGTDVDELDSALNNRLIHINHTLSVNDWIEGYASKNCHKLITSFIKAYPEKMYQSSENSKAYATPRSWTMLSEFIIANFGKNSSPNEFLPDLKEVANGFVGNSAIKFIQYCEDMLSISINDVIDNYDNIKNDLHKYNRDKNSELIQSLKEIDITKLSNEQVENVYKFLENVDDDEKVGYILHLLDNSEDVTNPKLMRFLLRFEHLLRTIERINDSNFN